VIAIGPLAMMKAVTDLTRPLAIKTIVSLNPIMVDGTGMCGACRVTVDSQMKFACVDGPEFDGHLVDFDSLIQRLKTYTSEEQNSRDRFLKEANKECRLEENRTPA
jgi:ferredoxin--NADP+ reductase